MKSKHLRILGRTLAFVLLFASAASACGQNSDSQKTSEEDDEQPSCDSPKMGALGIYANGRRFVNLDLTVCVASDRVPKSNQELLATLGCPPGESHLSTFKDSGLIGLEMTCRRLLQQSALQFSDQVIVPPVQQFLRSVGIGGLAVGISIPQYGVAHCEPVATGKVYSFQESVECEYVLKGAVNDPQVIRYSFGYSYILVARIISILGLLLLAPIILTFWFRRRALSVPEEAKPTIVFAYRRFIVWTALGGALIWWSAIDALHAESFVQFLLPTMRSNETVLDSFLPWIILWMPPVVVYFSCLALSSPIHSLRGMTRTRAQAVNQSFWVVARFVLPLSLLVVGIAELTSSPRIAVLSFAAWIVTARFTRQKVANAYGMELQAVTAGDLRDRAFSIAKKAGAKLSQLYVLPAERVRMANAFAHAGSNIYLTDYLVKNLSRREVDAVIGHEVTHLQKKHIRMRVFIWVVAAVAFGLVAISSDDWIPSGFPTGPVIYGLCLLLLFVVSRRNEFSADAGAFRLTGDAEAMITALVKISRLNTMPIHWGKVDEKLLTHPSTLRRINHLARLAGIPEARIPQLLEQTVVSPTEVYPIPATAFPSGKVFSTRFKGWVSWIYGSTLVISAALVPAILASTIGWNRVSGRSLCVLLLAGTGVTFICCLVISNFLPLVGVSGLAARLGEKFGKEAAPAQIRGGLLVSLAPDASPRIYEGNWAWDIGFLAVSKDVLYYSGEETRFVLQRDQITAISLGPGPVGWFKTPAAYVTWRDSRGAERIFNLRPLRLTSMMQMARQTRRLVADLQNWHRGIPLPDGSILPCNGEEVAGTECPGAPEIGNVTSMSPRTAAQGNRLVRVFLLDIFVAAGVAILFGLQDPIPGQVASPLAPVDFSSRGGAFLYVLVTIWIIHALLLWPYWRFRETATPPVAEVPS